MKKLVLFMTMAISLLTMVSFSYASWEVTVTNNCKKEAEVEVFGEHLFWQQVDCRVTVSGGTSKICKMPGGICPLYAKTTFNNNTIATGAWGSRIPACFNVKVILKEGKDGLCIMTDPHPIPDYFGRNASS